MNNIQSFQDFVVGVFDKLAYPLTFLILGISGYNLYEIGYPTSQMNNKFSAIEKQVIEVRDNVYHNSMYNILKQSEKLAKDPGDIKKYDLAKFQRICTDKAFVEYVRKGPGEPFLTDIKNTCKQISDARNQQYKNELNTLYVSSKGKLK